LTVTADDRDRGWLWEVRQTPPRRDGRNDRVRRGESVGAGPLARGARSAGS